MQLDLFQPVYAHIPLADIFAAYFSCRRNKRNTTNALAFELDFEANLIQLHHDINCRKYEVGRSIAFIIHYPVKREIFAADFKDRVVHHLIIGKINHLFEKQFIYDNYSCRTGKGALFGIHRVERFIRKCSQNYTRDAYILKMDIQSFFMKIDKNILYKRLHHFIEEKYPENDKYTILELCHKVIYNQPKKNCIIKGYNNDWNHLPRSKSLFHVPDHCGLPIGNLTSQIFANFYMDKLDHFIKSDLGIKYYGRYVDDFIIIHEDSLFLKKSIQKIHVFLASELRLNIHPRKIYLQHYSKGVSFLGIVIKPGRTTIGKRIKGNFYRSMMNLNKIVEVSAPNKEDKAYFLSSMNSYLGLMKHHKSYLLRKKMILSYVSAWWWNHFYLSGGYAKFVQKCKPMRRIKFIR